MRRVPPGNRLLKPANLPVFSGETVRQLVRFDPNQARYTITPEGRAILQEFARQAARQSAITARRNGGTK